MSLDIPARVLDQSRSIKYNVRISDDAVFEKIIYPHVDRDMLSGRSKLTLSRGKDSPSLAIDDGKDSTKYPGRVHTEEVFVAEFHGDNELVLRPVRSSYDFRQASSPGAQVSEDDRDEMEDDPPSDDNPFDYRHYLDAPPVTDGQKSLAPSATSTPVVSAVLARSPLLTPSLLESTPTSVDKRPVQRRGEEKSAKPVRAPRPRVKAAVKERAPVTVRKSGDLIIEGDEQPTKRRRAPSPAAEAAASPPPAQPVRSSQRESQDGGSGAEDNHPAGMEKPALVRRQSAWNDDEMQDFMAALNEDSEEDEPVAKERERAQSASESESEEE